MAAAVNTFSVPLVGGGWLSSRSTPDVSWCLRRQLRDLDAGLKSSDCPFRSAPVIAPSSPQSPPTPFYPSSHDSSEIPKDGCWNRRLLISSTVSDMFGGAELFIIHNMITSVCSSCPENRRQGYVSSPCTNQGPVTPSNSLFTNTAGVKGAIKMHNSF
jgi:hypothetical protein